MNRESVHDEQCGSKGTGQWPEAEKLSVKGNSSLLKTEDKLKETKPKCVHSDVLQSSTSSQLIMINSSSLLNAVRAINTLLPLGNSLTWCFDDEVEGKSV